MKRGIFSKQNAFTLTELLVVIGVIMALAALLLSAIARAKEKGRSAYCLNNLRQMSALVMMYAEENTGFIPAVAQNSQASLSDDSTATAKPGGGGGSLDCQPDSNGMTWICHVPPGNPADAHCNYVGFPALGGHKNHSNDHCGSCSGTTCLSDAISHLLAVLKWGKGFTLVQCPSDQQPEYKSIIDENGIPRLIPISYNENLEFAKTGSRLDQIRKPFNTILLFDGKPSAMIGEYEIESYNTEYAVFRHLGRLNAVFGDGHAESLQSIAESQVLLSE